MKKKSIRIKNKEMTLGPPSDTSASYELDYTAWAKSQSLLLKKRQFDKLDIEHLIEEIEEVGLSNKNALESHLKIALIHLLKQKYDPRHICTSWQNSIDNALLQIDDILEDNPSLKNHLSTKIGKCYSKARIYAAKQTGLKESVFPKDCPWTLKQVLNPN